MLESEPSWTAANFFPFASQSASFRAALDVILSGRGGVCLLGESGIGKSAMLDRLFQCLPSTSAIARLGPEAAPEDVAQVIASAQASRRRSGEAANILIGVDDADRLRRDTLDLLNDVARMIVAGEVALHLVATARPTFVDRLAVNGNHALLSYLDTKLTLWPLAPGEAEAFAAWCRSSAASPAGAPDLTGADTPRAVLAAMRPVAMKPLRTGHDWNPLRSWTQPGTKLVGVGVGVVAIVGGFLVALPRSAPPSSQLSTTETTTQHQRDASLTPPAAINPVPVGTAPPDAPPDDKPPRFTMSAPPRLSPSPSVPASPAPASVGQSERGLILVAEPGDTLATLYRHVYRGVRAPSFERVAAANPGPIRAGALLVFPTPPDGWRGQ